MSTASTKKKQLIEKAIILGGRARVIAGIDPGLKGAIAFLVGDILVIKDMPLIGKEIDGEKLAELFLKFTVYHVWLESANSFGMGRQSAFNFGQGVGVIKGVLAAHNLPHTTVTPVKWKKYFNLTRDKNKSRELAATYFPLNTSLFKRKKDDGRAEAALIAVYGKQVEDEEYQHVAPGNMLGIIK